MIETFKRDVDLGLSSNPKFLSSKYFYNAKGDELFVQIMNLPEYYLTRCELDIFKNKTDELIENLTEGRNDHFELIELGAGDGLKTKELLSRLVDEKYKFDYLPVDISQNALDLLEGKLTKEIPELSIRTQQGDYFEILNSLKNNDKPKVVLFLGSNMGNMDDKTASDFLKKLCVKLQKGDKLLVGVDLIKKKEIVLPAYNDSTGITAMFNLNLLDRINSELVGNFNQDYFKHQPEYELEEGVARSFLVSTVSQNVELKSVGKTYSFEKGEKIHTEISRKYNDQIMEQIIEPTAFKLIAKILDERQYFADYIFEKA